MSTTKLREQVAVICPVAEADARIESFLTKHRDADGAAHFGLRVPLGDIDGFSGLALEHGVRIVARRDRDDQNLNDLIRVAWKPEGGGRFPSFEGTLVTWAEHDPTRTQVELDGTYAPPMGAGGEAFDATIGHTIAQRTARAFLEDIARAIADEPPR